MVVKITLFATCQVLYDIKLLLLGVKHKAAHKLAITAIGYVRIDI